MSHVISLLLPPFYAMEDNYFLYWSSNLILHSLKNSLSPSGGGLWTLTTTLAAAFFMHSPGRETMYFTITIITTKNMSPMMRYCNIFFSPISQWWGITYKLNSSCIRIQIRIFTKIELVCPCHTPNLSTKFRPKKRRNMYVYTYMSFWIKQFFSSSNRQPNKCYSPT